jgi:hypothetical protein
VDSWLCLNFFILLRWGFVALDPSQIFFIFTFWATCLRFSSFMCACAIESCTRFIFFDDFFTPDSLLLRAQNLVVFFSLYSRGKNLSHPLNVWYRRAIFHLTTSKEKELNFLEDPTLIFYELRRNGKMWILFHFMFLVVWENYSFPFFFFFSTFSFGSRFL